MTELLDAPQMAQSEDRVLRAVRAGEVDIVRTLVRDQPELVRTTSPRGGSIVLEAFEREFVSLADWLLAERERLDGAYVLDVHEAASMGRPDALRRALTQDPLVFEEPGPAGFLPLHRAAYRAHLDVAQLLLEAGADPNAPSANGARMTALHSTLAGWRRFEGNEAYHGFLEFLLSAGADTSIEMDGGWTARSAAERDGIDGALALLGAQRSVPPQGPSDPH